MANKQAQNEAPEAFRNSLVAIIKEKATAINRPKLLEVRVTDIKKITGLPRERISCTALGVPLYIDLTRRTIAIADPVANGTNSRNGCRQRYLGATNHPDRQ